MVRATNICPHSEENALIEKKIMHSVQAGFDVKTLREPDLCCSNHVVRDGGKYKI